MSWSLLWPGLRALALCVAMAALSGCAVSEAQRLDALTSPEPDALRVRAMRRLSLATAYYEQGQNDVAQQEVRAALQIDPDFAEAYGLLGLIHQRDNATDLARQSFETAVQLASASPRPAELAAVLHNQAWFLCQHQRFDEAQAQFQRALAQPTYRQHAKTWLALGACQLQAGHTDLARRSWQATLQLEPNHPIARYQLALLAWQASQPEEARSILAPLNNSPQASANSLWLGLQIARALSLVQEQQALALQLTQRFPQSAEAQAWAQQKF